jgi:DMSO/TMAO reductase YedYZ heme-binding membrane subunit
MMVELSFSTARVARSGFFLHDFLSSLLVKYLFTLKKVLLVVAHLSLLAFLLPEIRKDLGELAANILIFLLFLSPLARITRMRLLNQLMSLRRELGILMAYLALVHGLGYILDPSWTTTLFPIFPLYSLLGSATAYFYGMMALLLTLPLLITSNNFSQKHLGGKNWKRVHRLVYGVFIFAVLHRFLQREDLSSLAQAFVLVGSYILVKVYSWKPFWGSLNLFMQKIGSSYKEFSLEKKQNM